LQASFKGAHMDKASLRNVHATNADLSGASLVGAVLCSMTACHSTWRTCNFQDANLGHSVFCGAIFNGLHHVLPFCKPCAHTWAMSTTLAGQVAGGAKARLCGAAQTCVPNWERAPATQTNGQRCSPFARVAGSRACLSLGATPLARSVLTISVSV